MSPIFRTLAICGLILLTNPWSVFAVDPPVVDSIRPGDMAQNAPFTGKVQIHLNQYIWIDVRGELDLWLGQLGSTNKRTTLVPCLNGIPLKGIYPENPYTIADTNFYNHQPGEPGLKVYHFRFLLSRRDNESKEAWKSLLNRPVVEKPLTVTLATDTSEQTDTNVTPGGVPNKDKPTPATLEVIPPAKGLLSLCIISFALFLFLLLAYTTDILRDPLSPRRPDRKPSYSLGRSQMAFWCLLVLTSFLLIWAVTGDMDTITTSVLGLIGISAGTALGSAIIDSAKTDTEDLSSLEVAADLAEKDRSTILAALKVEKGDVIQKLVNAEAELQTSLTANDVIKIEKARGSRVNLKLQLAKIDHQIAFYKMPPWKVVLYDLLGDRGSISFHRFQIFVWTIVLGMIFVSQVWTGLTMPEFSATLLGLMGISAGTYIGFKLPDQKTPSTPH
jgi:hypothetical protein